MSSNANEIAIMILDGGSFYAQKPNQPKIDLDSLNIYKIKIC
jgi:hypothetical protein